MTIAYLDTPSGISGNMFLGCLLDAGWPIEALRETIHLLNWPTDSAHDAWSVERHEVMRGPLRAILVDVQASEAGQPHRRLNDIRSLLEDSQLPESVTHDALAVFTRLGEAEAAVHGTDPESIHFHEVGALDSIIDIVGVCAGVHALELTTLYAGALPMGSGFVNSQHGKLPLPAPATLELLAQAGAPIRPAPGPGELVTPTGAALVAHFVGERWQQPEMRLRKVALGAGFKEFEWPNVARLWLGEPSQPPRTAPYTSSDAEGDAPHRALSTLIETNIDDMNPEFYASVATTLFDHGARDVWWTPIQMKKNRPGVKLSVLVPKAREVQLAQIILRTTTTFGMRIHDIRGYVAERRMEQVETPFGSIPVKLKILEEEIVAAVPEFDACHHAAQQHDVAIRQVYEAAAAAAWQRFLEPRFHDA
ncbi:MAG: nickel pincer cofactor biosynthesis protein LarC [Chloroflexota bacterium]|nr:nickel pincer cofactor biosynthesis protein LarC [Chloroflexota bacterium]